jgi:hypothetical protein
MNIFGYCSESVVKKPATNSTGAAKIKNPVGRPRKLSSSLVPKVKLK